MRKNKRNKLIVGDISWAETIPEWLLNRVKAERFAIAMASIFRPDMSCVDKVGDAELLVYLYTLGLRQPLTSEQTGIFKYLVAKFMKDKIGELPEDYKNKLEIGLTSDEEYEYRRLKSTIYDKRGGDIYVELVEELKKMIKESENGLKQQKLF